MRTRGNPETQFCGAAKAKTSAVGKVVRTMALVTTPQIDWVVSGNPFSYTYGLMTTNGNYVFMSAAYDTALSRTTDNVNFTSTATLPSQVGNAMGGNGALICAHGLAATSTGNISRSIDNGTSWATQPTLPSAVAWLVLGTDGKGKWMCAETGNTKTGIMKSTDDGATWSLVTPLPSQTYQYTTIAYFKGGWYVGNSYGTVYRSIDEGASWQTTGVGNDVYAAGDYLFACNSNGSNVFQFSMDGYGWSAAQSPSGTQVKGMFYLNGLYVSWAGASVPIACTRNLWNWTALGVTGGNYTAFSAVFGNKLWLPLSGYTGNNCVVTNSQPYDQVLSSITE